MESSRPWYLTLAESSSNPLAAPLQVLPIVCAVCCFYCVSQLLYLLGPMDFLEYEKKNSVPSGTLLKTLVETGDSGSWAKMERGEFPSTQLSSKLSAEVQAVVSACFLFWVSASFLMSSAKLNLSAVTLVCHGFFQVLKGPMIENACGASIGYIFNSFI